MLHLLIIQIKAFSVNKAEIRKYLITTNVIYSLAYLVFTMKSKNGCAY